MTADIIGEKARSGRLAAAATAAWIMWLAQWAILWAEPSYDAPESPLDYAAVVILSLALLATATALLVVRREVTPPRASLPILLASLAASATGLASLVEKAFGVDAASNVFVYGARTFFGALAVGGLLTVTGSAPQRSAGIALLVNAAAYFLGQSQYMAMAIAWLWLASEARRGRFGVDARLGGSPDPNELMQSQ